MENTDKPVLPLGDTFEVIEEASASTAPAPPAAAARTPFDPPAGPIRSANAWASMGLVIALCGLMGPWASTDADLGMGLLLSFTCWYLLRSGFAAVQRTGVRLGPILPIVLIGYAATRIALSEGVSQLGWLPTNEMLDASGALLTLVGGVVALVMPRVAARKDKKLPPAGNPLTLDKQFSRSLLAYLMVFFGLRMPWTDLEAGVDSLFGGFTLLLAMLMIWASWVSIWNLWQKQLVLGKLGLLLFLAPMEVLAMGLVGIIRLTVQTDKGLTFNAYSASPDFEAAFLPWGAGPLLVAVAGAYGLYLIGTGAKEAMEISKRKKAEEIASRKADRAARRGAAGETAAADQATTADMAEAPKQPTKRTAAKDHGRKGSKRR